MTKVAARHLKGEPVVTTQTLAEREVEGFMRRERVIWRIRGKVASLLVLP